MTAAPAIAVILAFCINTALQFVLGEIVPKTFTLARASASLPTPNVRSWSR